MEIIFTETGKNKGRISVARTLASMQVGETWIASTADVEPFYVRHACSKLRHTLNRDFTVSHTLEHKELITVKRTA